MIFPEPLRYVKPPPPETWEFLKRIDWFTQCGIGSDLDKEAALDAMGSPKWEDFTLERRNDITAHLANAHSHREREWNKVAKGVIAFTEEHVFPRMTKASIERGFSEAAIHQIEWDIASFIQEEVYASWGVPRFFDKLIEIYRDGYLPCGWIGSYPYGEPQKY